MRYLWIALGFALLHRLLVFGIALLAFCCGMSAFGGSSNALALFHPLMTLAALLDLPAVAIKYLQYRLAAGPAPHEIPGGWATLAMAPSFPSYVWSLCVGITVSVILYRRKRAKEGDRPPTFWKSGL